MGGTEHDEIQSGSERAAFEARRRLRQQRRQRRLVTTGIVTFLAVLLVAITAWFTYQKGMRGLGLSRRLGPRGVATVDRSGVGAARDGTGRDNVARSRLHILVIGTDEAPDYVGRTDTMMLVSYDPATGEAGVLSIPRDTRVQIPGHNGFHKANAAHAFGGPDLAMRTVSRLLDVDIDHYIVVSFAAFEQVVDALGGVTMLVERPMRYDDFAQGLHIDIKPGLQVLNGEQALHYVRFRADRLGDISLVDPTREVYDGRVKRQLDFVKAVAAEALSWKTLPKLPQLLPKLFDTVRTDISYDRAVALIVTLRNFESTRLDVAALPGTTNVVGGASYWIHDPVRTRLVVDRIIYGEQVVKLEVLNGSGGTGVAARAADMLRRNGYDVVRVGNAPGGFGHDETKIIVRGTYGTDVGRGQHSEDDESSSLAQLQTLLGGSVVVESPPSPSSTGGGVDRLPSDNVLGVEAPNGALTRTPTGDASVLDATIILGRDFEG